MLLDSWMQVGRVLAIGALAYATLLVLLRVSGKRTLAKLNAFDLVVTVALGSTLATILLSSDVSLSEGVAALVLLVTAQLAVAWSSVRVAGVRRLVKAEPTLLVHEGRILEDRLRRQRVVVEEVRQAVRASGVGDLSLVAAVVLETDGSMSVITTSQRGSGDALADVAVPQRAGGVPG